MATEQNLQQLISQKLKELNYLRNYPGVDEAELQALLEAITQLVDKLKARL